MVDIRCCKRCKMIYKFGNNGLCSDCIKAYDEIILKVRDYLDVNPMSGLFEITEEVKVSQKDILYLLRQGRLSVRSGNKEICCLRCGQSIEEGQYCTKCLNEVRADLNKVISHYKADKAKPGNVPGNDGKITKKGKMYTLYRRKDYT